MKILTKGTYYGTKKRELNNKGVILSEYDYHTPETDWHFHENPYFMYVLQGEIFDINKREKKACPAGTFMLHNWNETHKNTKHSEYARGFHIEFERKWFEQKKLSKEMWEGSKVLSDPNLHHLLGKLYFEFNCWDAFSEVSIDLLLLRLCEETKHSSNQSSTNEPPWIQPLKQILNEQTEDISLTSLSKELGVHPVHLSRAIPKYFTTTLGDYLRRQKVKKAIRFLMDPSLSLTEITYLCGFSDQSHFIRTFKTYFGITPGNYRRQMS